MISSTCSHLFTSQKVISGRSHIKLSKSSFTTFKISRCGIPIFKFSIVACPCTQVQHKLPDHCLVQGHVAAGLEGFEFRPIPAALLWLVLQVLSFLAGTPGSLGLKPCFISGFNVIDFRTPCMPCLKPFVMSSGPLMSRRGKSLTDLLGQRSKKSNPCCIIFLCFTMRIIISTM